MKKTLLLSIIFLCFLAANAQVNFSRVSIGTGGGFTQSFSDVQKHRFDKAALVTSDFYFTPFISAGIETQFGKISGGDKDTDLHNRYFQNSYTSFFVNGKLQLGQFIDYMYNPPLYAIKGLFVSGGVGVIKNNLTDIVRVKPGGSNYVFPGVDKSTNLMIPLSAGINFGIPDAFGRERVILTLSYAANITYGEGMDGYNDPPTKFENNHQDIYTFASFGIKYTFGPEGLFYK